MSSPVACLLWLPALSLSARKTIHTVLTTGIPVPSVQPGPRVFAPPWDVRQGRPSSSLRTLRALATITSCPNALSKRLIQGECVPISSAIRLRGIARTIPATHSHSYALAALLGFSPFHPARSTNCCGLPDPVRWSVSAAKNSCSALLLWC